MVKNGFKRCSKCKEELNISKFNKDRSNKDRFSCYCRECGKKKSKKYHAKNRDKLLNKMKEYRNLNKEYFKNYNKEYYNANREYHINRVTIYQSNRRKKDFIYDLKLTLRSAVWELIKRGFNSYNIEQILGINRAGFMSYIESMWDKGMNWGNYGRRESNWVLDHKIPLKTANTQETVTELFHYTNLQPMWASDNRQKAAKIDLPTSLGHVKLAVEGKVGKTWEK